MIRQQTADEEDFTTTRMMYYLSDSARSVDPNGMVCRNDDGTSPEILSKYFDEELSELRKRTERPGERRVRVLVREVRIRRHPRHDRLVPERSQLGGGSTG